MNSELENSDDFDIRTADTAYYDTMLPSSASHSQSQSHSNTRVSESEQIEQLMCKSREEYEMQQIIDQIAQIDKNCDRIEEETRIQHEYKVAEEATRRKRIEPIMRYLAHSGIPAENRGIIQHAIDDYRAVLARHIWLDADVLIVFMDFLHNIERRVGIDVVREIKNACKLASERKSDSDDIIDNLFDVIDIMHLDYEY